MHLCLSLFSECVSRSRDLLAFRKLNLPPHPTPMILMLTLLLNAGLLRVAVCFPSGHITEHVPRNPKIEN